MTINKIYDELTYNIALDELTYACLEAAFEGDSAEEVRAYWDAQITKIDKILPGFRTWMKIYTDADFVSSDSLKLKTPPHTTLTP